MQDVERSKATHRRVGQRYGAACGGTLHLSPPLTCSSAAQPAAELVELIQGLVADPHLPGLAAVVDRDRKPEHVFERLFNRASVRILHATSPGLRFGAAAEVGLGDGLHVADAQALLDDPTRDSYGIRDSKKRTRMPGRDPALDNKVLDLWREVEKPDHVVDVRPALAQDLGQVGVGIAELVHQAPVAGGFLNRIEVRALDILDNGVFERGPVVDLNDDHRHLVQAGHLRRAPAPLAGDDFIRRGLIGHRPHQDRLHDAALADRSSQGFDLIWVEVLAWIARIGAQELNRDLALPQLSLGRRLVVIADEGRQAASEPETDRLLRHDASPLLSTSVRQHGPHYHVPSRPGRRLTPTPNAPYAPHAQRGTNRAYSS